MAVPPAIIHFDQIFPNKNPPACLGYPHDELETPRCSPPVSHLKDDTLGSPSDRRSTLFEARNAEVTGAMFHTQHLLRDSKLETTSISPAGADPLDSILEYTCVYTCIYIYIYYMCIYLYI